MAYSESSVDKIIEKFEAAAERQQSYKHSMVKLRAAEGDLLKVAEVARNELQNAVGGSKDKLEQVFGGTCERFFRFKNVLTEVQFSDMYKGDQRWKHLQEVIEAIEIILKDRGAFKPWTIGTQAISSLQYKGFPNRLSPGQLVSYRPEYEGSAATGFEIDGKLPEGLTFNKSTGEIKGRVPTGAFFEPKVFNITAKNDAGSVSIPLSISIGVPPPESVVYDIPEVIYAQEPISWAPVVTGGNPTEYFVSPALPEGLKLNAQTGVISGTPPGVLEPTEYTVTAKNKTGSCTGPCKFSIIEAPPVGLKYDDVKPEYPRGAVIRLNPKLTLQTLKNTTEHLTPVPGMKFTIEPALPESLKISERNGVITGQANVITDSTVYTVTVQNASGSTSAPVEFAIILKAPENLSYPDLPDKLYTGRPVTFTPQVEGGVSEWICNEKLPEGLEFDPQSGVIHGVPREIVPRKPYTITARNPDGETSVTVQFSVSLAPPTELAYPDQKPEYPRLIPMSIQPTVEGTVDEYTITPALPAGIAIDPKTGVISGTPTEVADSTEYTVTATNTTGSVTAPVTFAVKTMPPTRLSFPGLDELYYVGEPVTITPEVEGGATEWTVEPALPDGLTLDPKTGVISGKPATITPEQGYVVTASNEAGGTSEVITFEVTAPAPVGLSYNAQPEYRVGHDMECEPVIESGVTCVFSIEPQLPEGMLLHPDTGVIHGNPSVSTESTTYTVTAKNVTGSTSAPVTFSTKESTTDEVTGIDHEYAEFIESVTDIADIGDEPDRKSNWGNWMVWMVHRAWLNDPTLDHFDFTNLQMPPPDREPRVAPKLMKALERNNVIVNLLLNNSSLTLKQGPALAAALKVNNTLEVLNVDSNYLDSACIKDCALALMENKSSKLKQWRFNGQKGIGEYFGRPVEEAIANMAREHKKIVKLGFSCADAHWNDVINKALIRNTDLARRLRKGTVVFQADVIPAVLKTLSKVTLVGTPTKAVWEMFDMEDSKLSAGRECVGTKKCFPTKEQLQAFVKTKKMSLKFSEVGPLHKALRAKVLDAAKDTQVSVADAYGEETLGELRGWTEKNDNFNFDVWPADDKRLDFGGSKPPTILVSDEFAAWLLSQ